MVMFDTQLTTAAFHIANADRLSPMLLLSETGYETLRAVAEGSETASSDVVAARGLMEQVVTQGGELRSLLEELAQDLAAGNVTAAQSRLTAVLTPVRRIDETYHRFREAQRVAESTLAEAQAASLDGNGPMGAGQLRQLHATASAVAAAFDELAVCAQAWVDLIDPESGQ